ncbi:MAG: hypothetical protein AAF829_08865 [Pseudomonadota bacterium]
MAKIFISYRREDRLHAAIKPHVEDPARETRARRPLGGRLRRSLNAKPVNEPKQETERGLQHGSMDTGLRRYLRI